MRASWRGLLRCVILLAEASDQCHIQQDASTVAIQRKPGREERTSDAVPIPCEGAAGGVRGEYMISLIEVTVDSLNGLSEDAELSAKLAALYATPELDEL